MREMKGKVVYQNGMRVRLNGEIETIHGGEFAMGVFTEGPRAGEVAAIKKSVAVASITNTEEYVRHANAQAKKRSTQNPRVSA